jgi:Transposase
MYHYFQFNREEFLKHYHKRSNIESTNAAIKRKFGETLKSKKETAQVNELLCKIIAYNLTVVIHEMYENGVVGVSY